MYFVSFSVKYSKILRRFKELQNVEVITEKGRITIPKVNLFKYSYYLDKKTMQKVPQYSFVIPKIFGEQLDKEGVKKVKIIVEVPEVSVSQ
jgi:hypothetical protein